MLILSAGAMGTTPLLMRSRPTLPSLSPQLGKHLGINGDHIAAIEYDEQKVRDVLGLPGYGQIYKGNHISTMTYDCWTGKHGNQSTASASRSRRSTCRRSRTRCTTTGATPPGPRRASVSRRRQSLSTFNNHIEMLAMVEDTHDGEFFALPPIGSHVRPNAGPLGVGPFRYQLSEQSVRVREAADAAMQPWSSATGWAAS